MPGNRPNREGVPKTFLFGTAQKSLRYENRLPLRWLLGEPRAKARSREVLIEVIARSLRWSAQQLREDSSGTVDTALRINGYDKRCRFLGLFWLYLDLNILGPLLVALALGQV